MVMKMTLMVLKKFVLEMQNAISYLVSFDFRVKCEGHVLHGIYEIACSKGQRNACRHKPPRISVKMTYGKYLGIAERAQ